MWPTKTTNGESVKVPKIQLRFNLPRRHACGGERVIAALHFSLGAAANGHDGAKRRRCGGVKAIGAGLLVTPSFVINALAMLIGPERETRGGERMEASI
jgi:hypothetical protein